MFSSKKILAVFLCLVIIGLSLSMAAGCGAKKPAGAVKVGVILPLSGASSAYGAEFKAGIEFVLSEIDAAGGIKSLGGAPVEIVYGDDTGSPNVARTEMERLMTTQNVSFVIGPFLDAQAASASPLSDTYKIPTISLLANPDSLQALNLYYWRTLTAETIPGSYGIAFVDYLKYLIDNYDVPHDRIALIWQDTVGGRNQQAAAEARLTQLGLSQNIVLDQLFNPTATDVTPYALIAKAANPDVEVIFPGPGPAKLWFKAMYDQEYYPPIVISSGYVSLPSFRDLVTPAIYDTVVEHCAVFGTPTFMETIPITSCQEAATKIKAWCQAGGTPFEDAVFFGAQAMYALWSALEKASSAKPEAINEAFHNLSIGENDPHFIMPIYAPALEWQADGRPKNYTPIVTQIQNGTQVIVWPDNIKQAVPIFP